MMRHLKRRLAKLEKREEEDCFWEDDALGIPDEVWTAAFEQLSPEATEATESEFARWGPLIEDDPLELSPAAADAFEEFDRLIAEQGYKFLG